MWGHNMKIKGSKTIDQDQIQKLKLTNVGKTETSKTEEIIRAMSTLKD